MRIASRCLIGTFTVGLLAGLSTLADDAGTAVPPTASDMQEFIGMSLEDLLDTPVYAASKREQSRGDVPAFVTVITAEDIQRYGYRTLTDIIASVGPFYQSKDRK